MNFDFSAILIFSAALAAVYGIASLFEKKPAVQVRSIRRGNSTNWFAQFRDRFRTTDNPAERRDEKRLMLLQAGFDSPDAIETFNGTRVALAIALLVLAMALVPLIRPELSDISVIACAALAAFVGYLAPLLHVRSRRANRQQSIRESLPDILDLLLVTTEAGLGLDTAVLRVGEETLAVHPIIANQLLHMSAELRAGRPRAEAFQSFAERCGIQETSSMVNLLVQSDRLGTSMATALRTFAEDMRAHRLLKVEELGQKIGVKLSGVLATCFLPALLITIGAPIGVLITATLKKTFHLQ